MFNNKVIILMLVVLLAVIFLAGCGSSAVAKNGDIIKLHYTGRLTDGTVFDTSLGSDPLEFTLGQGQMIPGFEQAVIGMKVGESKTVTIPTEEAYGQRRDDLTLEIEKSRVPETIDPDIGMQLDLTQSDGSVLTVTIIEVSETTIKIDANHPLAGQDLIFDIELVEIVASQSGTGADLVSISLGEALANGLPTLAEFGSSTCIPCKQMKPILGELAEEYNDKLNVVIVEVYEQRELTQQYGIMAIPTQIIFDSDGYELSRHIGLWPREEIIAQLQEMGIE